MYSEPEWSEPTSASGSLEVLKDGNIIEFIPIPQGKKCLYFGRHPENDVVLDHESASRKHAVIQFGPNNTAFLFDLGSTHGTFLNKNKIPASQFVKILNENSLFYFGASTRRFILNLEQVESTRVSNGADERMKYRKMMESYFSRNGLQISKLTFIQSNGSTLCSFDYSCILESDENLVVSASGITKEEALLNFFEDSYLTLRRLEFINERISSDEESEASDSDFDNNVLSTSKGSTKALSEDDVVRIVTSLNNTLINLKSVVDKKKSELANLERNEVEDFDIYIQNLQKIELENEIEKLSNEIAPTEKELERYKNIMKMMGIEVPKIDIDNDVPPEPTHDESKVRKLDIETSQKQSKLTKTEKTKESVFETESIEDEIVSDYDSSEDASNAEILESMKRKYGY